jgi:hypothetical protein
VSERLVSPLATVGAGTLALRIALIALIAVVVLAPVALRISQRTVDPFDPIFIFAAVYGVMFVLRPGAMLIRGDLVYEGPRTTLDVSATYNEMLVVALVGAVGFVAGYLSPVGARFAHAVPVLRGPRDVRMTGVVAFVLGAFGILALAIALSAAHGLDAISLFLQGRSAELRDTLAAPSFYPWAASFVVVPSAIVVVAVAWARRSWRFALFALALSGAVLLRALPTGNRLLLLPFVGALFVLYFVRRQRRPSLVLLIGVAAVAIVASAALSDLRGRGDRNESTFTSIRNVLVHPTRALTPFTTGPDNEMAATLAAALDVIPAEQPHSFGATILGDLVTRPIPRPLWGDKPRTPRERLIGEIWPVEAKRGALNPEFSVLLYFFWDFSYLGVLLGLALYGILARALFQYFLLHSSVLPVQIFFSVALCFIPLALRDSPVDTAIDLTFGLAPVLLAFWLARGVERRLSSRERLVTSATA